MDKIKHFQTILTSLLEEYADYLKEPNLETQVICDYQRNHYQLVKTGWDQGKRYHYCIFHFDIKNGKIWLQENRTDIRIAQELEARGIPKSEIVLGIHSPEARARSEYAAA
jgi:XisI protein